MSFRLATRTLCVAAAIAAMSAPAFAADQSVAFSGNSASFSSTSPILAGGDDVITFTGLASGVYNFTFSLSSQFTNALGATVNGQSATVTSFGNTSFAFLEGVSSSPFSVVLNGTPANTRSSYSGELSVTLVPEPGTWALMLAGIGVVGLLARRRG